MGFPGSSGSCLGLVAFFMAGGVSGGVSGTKADIGVGGGGGEGSPSGEGLGSWGILANTAAGAPGPGSTRGPLSMAAASQEIGGGGVSAAAAATAGGQDRGPAAHPARPAQRAKTQKRPRSEWERSRPVADEVLSSRLPVVGPPRPRFSSFAPRRLSPGRGPTLLYRPGWAWPLRMYQVRGG